MIAAQPSSTARIRRPAPPPCGRAARTLRGPGAAKGACAPDAVAATPAARRHRANRSRWPRGPPRPPRSSRARRRSPRPSGGLLDVEHEIPDPERVQLGIDIAERASAVGEVARSVLDEDLGHVLVPIEPLGLLPRLLPGLRGDRQDPRAPGEIDPPAQRVGPDDVPGLDQPGGGGRATPPEEAGIARAYVLPRGALLTPQGPRHGLYGRAPRVLAGDRLVRQARNGMRGGGHRGSGARRVTGRPAAAARPGCGPRPRQ